MSSIPYSRYLIYPIPWYSFLIVTGIVLAVILSSRDAKRAGFPKDTMIDLALWILPCGIAGARVYYVIFSWDRFRDDFWSVFRIWEGGIAVYGGIIGGFIALLLFCRKRRYSPLLLCDLIAPGLALAQGIGRWGNWFNIEAYGLPVTEDFLCFFPLAVQIPAEGNTWHLASFFYESVWDIFIFLFLLFMRNRKLKKKGDVFCFYLFLYSAGRLVIEETRLDSLYLMSSVRISQLLSTLLCMVILLRYYISFRKNTSVRPFVCFILLFLSLVCVAFTLLYSIAGFLFESCSSGSIVLYLSVSALTMIICLFCFRFSAVLREVSYADD